MTDLHTHILPGMDDGAKDLPSALELLELEYLQGVRNVALTSHYLCDTETTEAFLARRDRAFSELVRAVPEEMNLKAGCEVFFSPELLNFDPSSLCLQGTPYLLLELPILQKPAFLREVLCALRDMGIIPLIAHVERYAYIRRFPELLRDWIALGARIQVNAGSLMGRDRAFVLRLIKWGLVHVMASDAHSVCYRPPDLAQGLDVVSRRLGAETARELINSSERIFFGQSVPEKRISMPKCLIFRRFL